MTVSELIKDLQKEMDISGDRDVYLYISLGEDASGVSRAVVSKEVRVTSAWVNKNMEDTICETVIHLQGKKY